MIEKDFFGEGAHRFHRWLEIATVIVAMHVGAGAAATLHWPDPDTDPEMAGAFVMELAALAVAPPQPEDLAIGPPVEDSVPTPVPTQEAKPEEVDLPELQESPLAPDPEVVLPKEKPTETVEEIEEPETVQEEQQATEVNTASAVATAPPKVEAPRDTTAKAESAGVKAKPTQAEIKWQRALLFHLNRHKRYPSAARSRRLQGVAKVEFKIDGAGKLIEARLVDGSGSTLLDKEALAVLDRASPFPAPPGQRQHVHLALPIEFRIKR